MTEEEIKDKLGDFKLRQREIGRLQVQLAKDRTELAKAACPFGPGDNVVHKDGRRFKVNHIGYERCWNDMPGWCLSVKRYKSDGKLRVDSEWITPRLRDLQLFDIDSLPKRKRKPGKSELALTDALSLLPVNQRAELIEKYQLPEK